MQCGEGRKERVARCRAAGPEGPALVLIDQSWRASITAKYFVPSAFVPSALSQAWFWSSIVPVERRAGRARSRWSAATLQDQACRSMRAHQHSLRSIPPPENEPGLQMTTQETTSRDLAKVAIDGAPGRGEGAARVEARFAR
jgi:hypothetical protein